MVNRINDGSWGSLGDDRMYTTTETVPRMGTGGNLPAIRTPFPNTGGNLPPNLTGGTTWIQPPPTQTMGTGGNLPPNLRPPQGTGGNLPPLGGNTWIQPPPTVLPDENGRYPLGSGGHAPALPVNTTQGTGGNNPANPSDPSQWRGGKPPQVTQGTGGNQPPNLTPQPPVQLQGGFSPANVVTGTMNQIIDPNGAYMRNARQRGLEAAARGGNRAGGSIAAGASQRSALEAATPLFNSAMQLHGQREQLAFQGEQNQLERNRDYTRAQLEDWTNSRQFNREFYGVLSMMPINSAYQLNSLIQTYALENPEVYTADVISGMSNFFTQNFQQILSTYFPNMYGGGG